MQRQIRTAMAAACLAGGTLLTAPAYGQGVPVIDTASIAQLIAQLNQMQEDYTAQLDQIFELQQQYQMLTQQFEAITGGRGISDIFNDLQDIAEREAAEGVVAIVDAAISGSGLDGNTQRITRTLDELRDTFDLASLPDFLSSELPQDRALATQAGSGMAAIATAEDSYVRANESMDRVTDLVEQIDGNQDLKASVDFNTRMLAEVAFLLNENLRLQATIANSLGAQALAEARDGVAGREFFRPTDTGAIQ